MYRQLQDLLLKAARCEDFQAEFDFIIKFYGDDFNSSLLKAHLHVHVEFLGTCFQELGNKSPALQDITEYFKRLSPAARGSMSEVCTLLTILIIMPATNAVSEQSASAL